MFEPSCSRCADIVSRFRFSTNLAADGPTIPPKEDGGYGISVTRRGLPVREIMEAASSFCALLPWPRLQRSLSAQINRLSMIGTCDLVYLGKGGGSTNKLYGRWDQLTWSHPTTLPLAALLYFGWQLKFGWMACANPLEMEKSLKIAYRQTHDNRLPPLMKR